MNRGGMLAMMDAMIFMAVIVLAVSVTASTVIHTPTDERDAGDLLDCLLSSEVRMSDLSAEGDGSMVRTSDMMALYLVTGESRVEDYLTELLEAFSAGRHYRLTIEFGGLSRTLGGWDGEPSASVSRTVPVTSGGDLTVTLALYPS